LLSETVFGNTDLTRAKGLETCQHVGPSTIDHRTLQQSGPLPLAFLRGVGLPDNLIDYLPSLLNQPIQFYSCFISYSSKDQEFADRLHADFQNKGVRCWFAPHDMPIGAKIIDAIDEAIRLRDKVLLILSEHSVASDWVEEEVTRALAEERSRKTTVLFPIRVDDAVLNTNEAWARGLRIQRHIGDFCLWKDHDAYQKVLERVLRDLKVVQARILKKRGQSHRFRIGALSDEVRQVSNPVDGDAEAIAEEGPERDGVLLAGFLERQEGIAASSSPRGLPLILRIVTGSRTSCSELLVLSGTSGRSRVTSSSALRTWRRASSSSSSAKPVVRVKRRSKRAFRLARARVEGSVR
jgi:hypothetical protein